MKTQVRHRRFDVCVVAITGDSAGVARAAALAFAREGAKAALLARGAQGLQDAGDEVRSLAWLTQISIGPSLRLLSSAAGSSTSASATSTRSVSASVPSTIAHRVCRALRRAARRPR